MDVEKKKSSQWWWLDSQNKNNSNRSPWLQSTLADLDKKTKTMLSLIEEDADSFMQRAEMFYRKRPELISMVEDFYRTHRSLAERHEQAKSKPLTPSSPVSLNSYCLQKPLNLDDVAYDSYSEEAYGTYKSDESEVDDPDEEEVLQNQVKCVSSGGDNEGLVIQLKEEIEKLREENEVQRAQLMQKDEEKREVIRQLSLGMDLMRDENVELRQRLVDKNSSKRENRDECSKAKEGFLGRVFGGFGMSPSSLVAL